MKRAAWVALLTIELLALGSSSGAGQIEPIRDDGLVLAAVLEHTILPTHRRTKSGAGVPLTLVSPTIPMCTQPPAGQTRCRITDQWRRFLEPDAAGKRPGLVADDRTRRELIESLEARNTESHPLPVIKHPDVEWFDRDKNSSSDALEKRRNAGLSFLSLPGYSTDRHALVYGSYSCGSLCGYGWLFVLEHVSGQWRVTSSTVTVMA